MMVVFFLELKEMSLSYLVFLFSLEMKQYDRPSNPNFMLQNGIVFEVMLGQQ